MNSLIKINNVSKIICDNYIFNDVKFEIYVKGFYGLKGVSGSGKSTLLSLLGILDTNFEGEILFENKNIKNIKNKEEFIYENIGFVFQTPILFSNLTLKENLSLIETLDERKLNSLLHRLDLFSKKNTLAKKLSGGERLRLSLIRALINSPKILLLDEPTSALDDENSKIIMDFLKEESKNRAIFMVSHNEELLEQYCDHLYLLKDKKVSLIKENKIKILGSVKKTSTNNKLSLNFFFKYLIANFSKKRFKSLLIIFSLVLSFFIVGFSLTLSHDVSFEVKNSLNALIQEDQVILKSKEKYDFNEIVSVEESEAKQIILKSNYFYDYGYIYNADFEKQFADANYFSLVSKDNLTFYEVGLRSVSETVLLDDVPISNKIYPKRYNSMDNDEIILGLRKKDIKKICTSLGLEDLTEDSLSNYMKENVLDFCFYFSNDSWGYYNEVLLRLKAFFVVENQITLVHSNKDFVVDFFENKMQLPYSTNMSVIDNIPWTIKKQIYLKVEPTEIESAINEYFLNDYYELYDLNILKGNLNSSAFSSFFHKGKFLLTYATQDKVSYNSIEKYEKYSKNIFPTGGYYELVESALVSGFSNSIFFSSSEDDLLEVEYFFNEIKDNIDAFDLSQYDFGKVTYGNLITSALQKGVKLDTNYGQILCGRPPEGIDEVMISSSMCNKLFENYQSSLNQKIFVIYNYFDNEFGNIFSHTYMNVSGVYDSSSERIYQSPYWYPIFLVTRLDYPLINIQINEFICTVDKDFPLNINDFRFEIIDPLKTINESVESMILMIEKVLLIFTILLIMSSFGICLITIESSMKESSKEIGLMKSIGIDKFSIFKMYFFYNISYFVFAYIFASFSLFLSSKYISLIYFNSQFNFNVYPLPYLIMFILGFLIVIPIALTYTIVPMRKSCLELIKRYY